MPPTKIVNPLMQLKSYFYSSKKKQKIYWEIIANINMEG